MSAAPIDPGMYGEISAEALVANAHQEEANRQGFLQAREKGASNGVAFFAGGELATVSRVKNLRTVLGKQGNMMRLYPRWRLVYMRMQTLALPGSYPILIGQRIHVCVSWLMCRLSRKISDLFLQQPTLVRRLRRACLCEQTSSAVCRATNSQRSPVGFAECVYVSRRNEALKRKLA
jgi:hypothetical protein